MILSQHSIVVVQNLILESTGTILHDVCCKFIETFYYEYDTIAKDPPDGLNRTNKIFLGLCIT